MIEGIDVEEVPNGNLKYSLPKAAVLDDNGMFRNAEGEKLKFDPNEDLRDKRNRKVQKQLIPHKIKGVDVRNLPNAPANIAENTDPRFFKEKVQKKEPKINGKKLTGRKGRKRPKGAK